MKCSRIIILASLISLSAHAQWKQTGGPETGFVHSIVRVSGSLVVNGSQGGVYKSDDNGQHWREVQDGLPYSPFCYTLISRGSTLFAVVGTANTGWRTSIYRS